MTAELKVEHVIIAVPSASVETQRRIATLCVRAGVRAITLPALTPLTQGQAFLSRVRQIDLEDLLGRDPVNDRYRSRRSAVEQSGRDGDGRGRIDRLGIVPADLAISAGATGGVMICPSSPSTG